MLVSRRLIVPASTIGKRGIAGFAPSHRQEPHATTSSTSTDNRKPEQPQPPQHAERTTINVTRDEFSKTGGDHIVAEQVVASYHPANTKPEAQFEIAGRGLKVNPLEVSPANTEASKFTPEKDSPPGRGIEKASSSKRSSPAKARSAESIKQRLKEEASKSPMRALFADEEAKEKDR